MLIKDENVRKSVYAIAAAVGGLALIYGIVNPEQLDGWLKLVGAITGATNILALINTPKKGKHEA